MIAVYAEMFVLKTFSEWAPHLVGVGPFRGPEPVTRTHHGTLSDHWIALYSQA